MTGFVDFATLTRPSSPNTALLAPPGLTQAEADGAAPVYDVPAGDLYMRALKRVGERRGWVLGEQDPAAMRLTFVAVTPLLRFKDDVDVLVLPAAGQANRSTFAAYSRSRVGYSDLGTNLKRLNAFAEALRTP